MSADTAPRSVNAACAAVPVALWPCLTWVCGELKLCPSSASQAGEGRGTRAAAVEQRHRPVALCCTGPPSYLPPSRTAPSSAAASPCSTASTSQPKAVGLEACAMQRMVAQRLFGLLQAGREASRHRRSFCQTPTWFSFQRKPPVKLPVTPASDSRPQQGCGNGLGSALQGTHKAAPR